MARRAARDLLSAVTDTIRLRYVNLDERECLAVLANTWLYAREIKQARMVAEIGTDEECRLELEQLERRCTERLRMWSGAQ